jgi:acetoin:2,6-dichlorophenolindophenol oxidoreductase subunit alpha
MKRPKTMLMEMLKKMLEIRYFEEKVVDQYARGAVPGLAHLYIGEEAVAVGACANLTDADYITSTHRGHGHCLAKGGELKPMMAELFGKKTGYCKGKGGSMHIAAYEKGILGAMGIVGSGPPIAVGAALGIKKQKLDRVVICFFGDASSNEGTSHEAMNFASLHKLPVVFVCENNLYGISVAQHRHQAIKDIAVRAAGYDMPGVVVDGMNVIAVYEAVGKAVKEAKAGKGPSLVECKTYRFRGHFEGDPNQGTRYRTKEEMDAWRKRCPIEHLKKKLIREKIARPQEIDEIEEDVKRRVEEAFEYSKASPFPEPEETLEDLFA